MLSPTIQKEQRSLDHTINKQGNVFIERIPDKVYQQMVGVFSNEYHFQNGLENGGRMRIANYYVGLSRSLSDSFIRFIEEIEAGLSANKYPPFPAPEGFKPHEDNLLQTELDSGFSFASFDMAVTEEGLQNIEFQAVSTYPISAAKLNQSLLEHLHLENVFIFADSPATTWSDFTDLYKTIIAGDLSDGIVLTDRLLKQQKTNFEFYATQKELDVPIDVVDLEDIVEENGELFYPKPSMGENPIKINRLYNRILLAEALFEDNYPEDAAIWKFRFDKKYPSLKFINHPIKLYEVSKRLSPYVDHPSNPDCFELSAVSQDFQNGVLKYEDYVWKHKWGGAGHQLILSPTQAILSSLEGELDNYIVQKKVNFEVLKTGDGQDKIIELRFMTAHHEGKRIIVPMARLGHVTEEENNQKSFRIHFGENNKEGYGFSPVVIFED